jgi:hypothetical protein
MDNSYKPTSKAIKIIQAQAIQEGNYRSKTHFCNWFLWAVDDGVLDPKLSFSIKLCSI